MLEVWELDLPHPEKVVLAALAYSADKQGGSIFPSPETVARRTGYGKRQVRQVIQRLEKAGLLEKVRNRPHYLNGRLAGYYREYRLTLEAAKRLPPSRNGDADSGPSRNGDADSSRHGDASESAQACTRVGTPVPKNRSTNSVEQNSKTLVSPLRSETSDGPTFDDVLAGKADHHTEPPF